MSLDIYLENVNTCPNCGTRIGHQEAGEVYSQNITHNLTAMAKEAGVYEILWHPESNGIEMARQLILQLEEAIAVMKADPPRFEKHNSPNGWGLYENFLPWLEKLLIACKANPGATVAVSR